MFRVMAVYGVVGFVLLQIVDLAVPALLLPEWTYRLVALILLLGLPVAVVLAWALEVTPEGVRRTAKAAPGELADIIVAPASKRWPSGVLALVGVGALLVGAWYVGRQSAPAVSADPAAGAVSASLAVLPFADMTPDRDQEYFSDGIAEELLNLLAQIPELRVSARTSSFSFKGQDLEITEIAERLNVGHVLEGSVRKAGDEVRITAQLVRADDGFHVWSETWERTLDDIFAIQVEIAAAVVRELKIALLGETPKVIETDPAAYALYLQAEYVTRQQLSAESLERSSTLYRQALTIDSQYAAAWTGLASSYRLQATQAYGPVDEGFELAREAAGQALSVDSTNARAYAELGRIASVYDRDLASAARHLERALELAPTERDIILEASQLLRELGREEASVPLLEYLATRDPVDVGVHMFLGIAYLTVGRPDEALASFLTTEELAPGRDFTDYAVGRALMSKGDLGAALVAMQRESSENWRLIGLAMVHHALGQRAESDAAVAELIENYEQRAPYNIAYVLAYRGEVDRAFEWLEKAVEYNDSGLSLTHGDRRFDNIRGDPRWLPFLERIGQSPEQVAAIDFEIRLPQ
ncbi:MAG: tetratricopeptide repeat protein [Myxococcota bacterium]